jgi:hypothetical protein
MEFGDFTDIDDDDIAEFVLKYSFGQKNIKYAHKFYSKTPLFCYDYIDIDKTSYHFSQACLDVNDYKKYFNKVKQISKYSIDDLIDNSSHGAHFHIYNEYNGKLKSLVTEISGKPILLPEEMPSIGQFSLYINKKETSSRSSGVKSPRIFFMIGNYAIFYILFFDPFHEIRDDSNRKQ